MTTKFYKEKKGRMRSYLLRNKYTCCDQTPFFCVKEQIGKCAHAHKEQNEMHPYLQREKTNFAPQYLLFLVGKCSPTKKKQILRPPYLLNKKGENNAPTNKEGKQSLHPPFVFLWTNAPLHTQMKNKICPPLFIKQMRTYQQRRKTKFAPLLFNETKREKCAPLFVFLWWGGGRREGGARWFLVKPPPFILPVAAPIDGCHSTPAILKIVQGETPIPVTRMGLSIVDPHSNSFRFPSMANRRTPKIIGCNYL